MLKESQRNNIIITDASCFILLDKIGGLEILKDLFERVFTTPEIANEYGKQLPEWVAIIPVVNTSLVYTYAELVDKGEASAIALAHQITSASLILDDLKARKLASQLNLSFTGTIGVLILAKQQQVIVSLAPYFQKILETDFRIPVEFLQTLIDKYDK